MKDRGRTRAGRGVKRRAPSHSPAATRRATPALLDPVCLTDFEPLARAKLSPMAYDYLAGGSAEEISLRWNRERLEAIRLMPRVLVDVSQLDASLELFGTRHSHPIILAPTAFHRLFHPRGELETVRGAGLAGITLIAATPATTRFEDMAAGATSPLWLQIYVQRDRGFTRDFIQRAEAAGCTALCMTVDTPVLGPRNRDARSRLELPPGMGPANLEPLFAAMASRGEPVETFHQTHLRQPFLDPSLTWKDITWLRGVTRLPLVLKGILAPDDARLAIEHGADAIGVSNHGGRNLDTTPATIDALPAVVEAVDGRVPVLFDGGIRRGTDVIKALALGARAVLIGRPYLWGLAAGGAEGVARVVEILRVELEMAMALCGAPNLAGIRRELVWRG